MHLTIKRNTCMVRKHHMAVLLANYVSAFFMGLCVSDGSHIKYTYMIGRNYSHVVLSNHASLSPLLMVHHVPWYMTGQDLREYRYINHRGCTIVSLLLLPFPFSSSFPVVGHPPSHHTASSAAATGGATHHIGSSPLLSHLPHHILRLDHPPVYKVCWNDNWYDSDILSMLRGQCLRPFQEIIPLQYANELLYYCLINETTDLMVGFYAWSYMEISRVGPDYLSLKWKGFWCSYHVLEISGSVLMCNLHFV